MCSQNKISKKNGNMKNLSNKLKHNNDKKKHTHVFVRSHRKNYIHQLILRELTVKLN